MTSALQITAPWVGRPKVEALALNRLSRSASTALVSRVGGSGGLPSEVVEEILERTDGVPLFIEELTSTLIESGVLRETDEGYALDGPLPELAIPATPTGSEGNSSDFQLN